MKSWSPTASYVFTHNVFKLKIPFIHQYNNIEFIQLKYSNNQIEIIGQIPKREYNKHIYISIPNNCIVLK